MTRFIFEEEKIRNYSSDLSQAQSALRTLSSHLSSLDVPRSFRYSNAISEIRSTANRSSNELENLMTWLDRSIRTVNETMEELNKKAMQLETVKIQTKKQAVIVK